MPTPATAAVYHDPAADFALEQVTLDEPRPDEALIRIAASGVCHTDLSVKQRMPPPAVLGHEGTGVVEAVGGLVTDVRPGDRVIISFPSCGSCDHCLAGRPSFCDDNLRLSFQGCRADGSRPVLLHGEGIGSAFFQQSSFATHAIAPARSLVRVEGDEPWELLAALPCGVLTGAGAVLHAFRAEPGDSLIIFGAGAVGLSALLAARLAGVAPKIAVDVVPERLALALELGATHAFDAREGGVAERVRALAPRGLRFALDTSAQAASWDAAVACLGMGGVFGAVTTPRPAGSYQLPVADLFRKAASFQGIILGAAHPRLLLPRLLDWQRQGRFPVERLIRTYPFAEINTAIHDSESGRTIKPVLLMG